MIHSSDILGLSLTNVGKFVHYYQTGEIQKLIAYSTDGSSEIVSDIFEYYVDGKCKSVEYLNKDSVYYYENGSVKSWWSGDEYVEFDEKNNIVRYTKCDVEIILWENIDFAKTYIHITLIKEISNIIGW
jgi:hypothetical protein